MIDSKNYVENVVRTDCVYDEQLITRLVNSVRILHSAMGLCTEAGEFLDMLKKHIYYGKPFDKVNAIEENGDALWYIGLAIDELKVLMDDVLKQNIEKLKLRYPAKFTETHAIDRNVEIERKFLEDFELAKSPLSKRAEDWIKFSNEVLQHIENYTVPQYGDKGEDQITEWSVEECLLAIKKRQARYGKNVREGQQVLDFLKMAHETQIACDKYKEEINGLSN